jgi:hypothetical protein
LFFILIYYQDNKWRVAATHMHVLRGVVLLNTEINTQLPYLKVYEGIQVLIQIIFDAVE